MANNENLTPFKKGQSGNPKGRVKGSKNMSTRIREMLECELDYRDLEGNKKKTKIKDILSEKILKMAMGGDIRAMKEVMDRAEGKVMDSIEINAHVDGEYKIIISNDLAPDLDDEDDEDGI